MNDKLARTMPPTTIARMSGLPLEAITSVLGADNTGAPRNGAMSTMKYTDANLNMIPEEYSPRGELKDPLRINRDTTSQGLDQYETSEDRGNPFLQATGSPQFNPHTAGTSHSMVADPPMNPQQFMQEDMMQQQPLMNPNVPRQEFDPYMQRRNRY
jgi:hypothetical protein